MKFCPSCGTKLEKENQAFCTECGQSLNSAQNNAEAYTDKAYTPYNNINEEKSADFVSPEPKKVSLRNAIISFVFANVMPFFSIYSMVPFVGIFMFPAVIVFFILTLKYRERYIREAGRSVGFTTAAKPIAIVSLILGIFLFIVQFAIISSL